MQVNSLKVLCVSDEQSMFAEHARSQCRGYDYQCFDDADVAKRLAGMQRVHGLVLDVVSESNLDQTVATREKLGFRYDLIALHSLRVRSLHEVFRSMVNSVRKIDGENVDGIRLSGLPIAIMNRLELVLHEQHPLHARFQPLLHEKELYVANSAESFPELAARAIGTWWLNAVCDLSYQGVGIQIDEHGRYSVCGVYSHPIDESFYFKTTKDSTGILQKVWRVRGNCDELSRGIVALDYALNQAAHAKAVDQEDILRKCFAKYPELLSMGIYDSVFPEVEFAPRDAFGIGVRPDFIAMNSVIPGLNEASAIIECKSPEMRLRLANSASRKFREAIDQLGRRYRQHFADPRTYNEQTERLGRVVDSPKLLLIIGRSAWQKEWLQTRSEHATTDSSDLHIASYDDIRDLAQMRVDTFQRVTSAIDQKI